MARPPSPLASMELKSFLTYGLWALGFGLWALGFGLWALGFGLWALGFGLWALGFGLWVLGSRLYLYVLVGLWEATCLVLKMLLSLNAGFYYLTCIAMRASIFNLYCPEIM